MQRTMMLAWLAAGLATMAAPALAVDPTVRITIEKTACYGRCPAYTLIVYPDDRYEWQGRFSVAVAGGTHGRLPAGTFAAVAARIASVRFEEFAHRYSLPDECDEWWTDNPSTRIAVATAHGEKSVDHYHGCRGFDREVELRALEHSLDRWLHVREIDGTDRPK